MAHVVHHTFATLKDSVSFVYIYQTKGGKKHWNFWQIFYKMSRFFRLTIIYYCDRGVVQEILDGVKKACIINLEMEIILGAWQENILRKWLISSIVRGKNAVIIYLSEG